MPALVAVLGVSLVVGSCSLPTDDAPRQIAADDVEYGLLSPTTAPPDTVGPEVLTAEAAIYLVDEQDRVVRPVRRDVTQPVNIQSILHALFDARPSSGEERDGLSNVIPRQTRLLDVRRNEVEDRVTLDLESFFPGLTAEEVSLAVAQVVFTVTEESPGAAVQFLVQGQQADISTAGGKSEPVVRRSDLLVYDPTQAAASTQTTPATGQGTQS